MRILVATDHWFPDHRGGAARVAAETAQLLADAGHEVEALAPVAGGKPREEHTAALSVHRRLARSALPQTLADPRRTERAARGRRADVMLAHTCTTAVGLARALPQVPLVLVYHASAVREARFERPYRSPPRRLALTLLEPSLRHLEREAVAAAARILVLSEFSRDLLAADHPDALGRVALVGGGVDTRAFAPGDRTAARRRLGVGDDRLLLLSVRRLEPRMGLEDLLAATAALGGVDLAVVGSGSLAAALGARRDALGLRDRVRLVGRVSDEALLDWYRAADLFVLPTVAYEGFGLVTAEALACGLPVVGTAVGATPELLAPLDERLVVRGAGPAALAAGIERATAILGPELRARCRKFAEDRLSWAVAARRWEAAVTASTDT